MVGIFRNLPIRKKFMYSYALIILVISLLTGGICTALTTSRLRQETLYMAMQLTEQVSTNIHYRAEDFEQFAFQMISDTNIRTFFNRNVKTLSLANRTISAASLENSIGQLMMRYSAVDSIVFMTIGGGNFRWEKGNPKISVSHIGDLTSAQLATEKADQSAGNIAWLRSADGEDAVLAKKVLDLDTLDPLGYIVFFVKMDFFRLTYEQGDSLIEPANIAIFDRQDDLIFSEAGDRMESLILFAHRSQEQQITFQGKNYLCVQSGGRWHTLCLIPMASIQSGMNWIWIWSMLTSAALGALSMWLAWAISRRITVDIAALSENMHKVEQGDLSVQAAIRSRDEIGHLTEQFNHMVQEIHTLIQSVYEEKLKRQAMEYQVLQAQINPHFLYNTLGSIRCLAQMNAQFDIENMLTALIQLLQSTISTQGRVCKLQTELSCVESYLTLQRIRYADNFSVRFDIADNTENCQVLSFTLQPLAENALLHGLIMENQHNEIVISTRIEHGQLLLEVRDNGVGMDEQTIHRILTGENTNPRSVTNIGIRNINERIRYFYGDAYGVSIRSTVGQGSAIILSLPYILEASDDQRSVGRR